MKKLVLALLLIIIKSNNSYSQVSFEKGYFINNSGDRVECLIKNRDWKYNPDSFEYKLFSNDKTERADISNIKEFGILNTAKYIRQTVDIDKSSDKINRLWHEAKPEFEKETLFLQVLVEGDANLYLYSGKYGKRYFYSYFPTQGDVEQLIFKRYLTSTNHIKANNQYRHQLLRNLPCSAIPLEYIEKLTYKEDDLIDFFVEYNSKCSSNEFKRLKHKKRIKVKLSVRPRINNSSLSIQNSVTDYKDTDFSNKVNFSIGIETEFIFPFHKNKWAALFEPTYQYYRDVQEAKHLGGAGDRYTGRVVYQSLELPIGIRHYFYLSESSKVLINALTIPAISLKKSLEHDRPDDDPNYSELDIRDRPNFAVGIGFSYRKYSIEFRSHTSRPILVNYGNWTSEYKNWSFIFGYSLFQN